VRSRLSYEGPFSISATVRLLRDVLGALEHAHGFGLVHRDIKPENIYLSGSHAVLADFGIAKAVAGQRGDHAITNPGETVGTPAYMAAEQLAGDPNTDHRADIYSVGVVAYELLAGRLPWRGKSPSERLSAQVRGELQPLSDVRDDIPEQLLETIDRCLAFNAEERVQTATDALRMLDGLTIRHSVASFAVTAPLTAIPKWRQTLTALRSQLLPFAKALAFAIWVFANVAYAGMRAQNSPSFGRTIAFIGGLPGTLVSRFAVSEGSEHAYGIELPRR
jgi:serine/threonine protein kinase